MPKLNALHNSICRDCDNLDYYSGYFCSLKPHFSIHKTECKDFVKRKVCVKNDEVVDCQFWCSGNHHSAPMEPCPLLDAKP